MRVESYRATGLITVGGKLAQQCRGGIVDRITTEETLYVRASLCAENSAVYAKPTWDDYIRPWSVLSDTPPRCSCTHTAIPVPFSMSLDRGL